MWTWRAIQVLSWLFGFSLLLLLFFYPSLGIDLFWNVLIPVAPALFVIAAGIWRNLCPLAGVALLPRHLGFSRKRRLSITEQGRLQFIGAILLFLVVPVRHLLLDTSGPATGMVLIVLAVAAFFAGYQYEWKSGWCSGLCPVHGVEKLYGQRVAVSPANAHCGQCRNCALPCPDSVPAAHPLVQKKTPFHRLSGTLLIGGLPGFIWGWFHVPDYIAFPAAAEVLQAFALPYLGMVISLLTYLLLQRKLPDQNREQLPAVFAAAAVSLYYWYRLPALIGFGLFPGDGQLADLTAVLPAWTPLLLQLGALTFFGWWMLGRQAPEKGWTVRPPFGKK